MPICAVSGGAFLGEWLARHNLSEPLTHLPARMQDALANASLVRHVRVSASSSASRLASQSPGQRGDGGANGGVVSGASTSPVAPLLLVHGEADTCHPIENAELLAAALQEAQAASQERGSHSSSTRTKSA